MPKLRVVTRDGKEHEIDGVTGLSVMENLRNAGFDEVIAMCGGCCSCATCHVIVDVEDFDRLARMGDDENDLLDGVSHRSTTSRLSCQIIFGEDLGGLRLRIAPEE